MDKIRTKGIFHTVNEEQWKEEMVNKVNELVEGHNKIKKRLDKIDKFIEESK